MANEIAIKIRDVSKSFKLPHEKISSVKNLFVNPFRSRQAMKTETQHALKSIDFDVKKGEFFGIVGRNGSGKSTLLKIIAEIYQPTKGRVTVNGRLVPFIELGVGFNPELTGRENVYLNGALMGFSEKEIDTMYDDIVSFAELEKFMDQKLKNYSSGMQVRLAFSVATRSDADILLIDEVLAVGDADFQRKCFNYFKELKRNKKTVVFVSHDMAAVREYCDRCILINNAEIVYEGNPEVAAEKYLRLFNDGVTTNENERTRNEKRWGDKSAQFKNVSITHDQDYVNITSVIRGGTEDIQYPILGFNISSSTGDVLCGTNNKILQKKVSIIPANGEMTITWRVPNIFGDDTLHISMAITHPDGVKQIDWWNDAAKFKNINEKSTPHPVSPNIDFQIK